MSRSFLDIRDLTVSYGATRALDGVTLSVDEGEVVGLVGESGSGKSTLVRAVLGILPRGVAHESGSVSFSGRLVFPSSDARDAELGAQGAGAVFQDPRATFCPVRTVGSQFVEALGAQGISGSEARQRALACLAAMDLDDAERVFSSYAFELSGGMCQRAALALALALRPRLLCADEPTSALDVVSQARVVEELAAYRREQGMALLVVSHDLRVIACLADRVAVMRQGRIVEEGPCAHVISDPRDEYTKQLIAAIPQMAGEVI